MSWFRRHRVPAVRASTSADTAHLIQFLQTRTGVEAYIEPRTAVTETTILLIAHDGEWTRRRVQGPGGAVDFARKQALPLYDATVVGYPKRMREYNARRKASLGDS